MKDLVRTVTGSRKCGCPFKLRAKPVLGGEGWMVKLLTQMCYVARNSNEFLPSKYGDFCHVTINVW